MQVLLDALGSNSSQMLPKYTHKDTKFHPEKRNLDCFMFSAGHQDPMNELMLSMIGAFAQFERSVLKERQAEGIEKAKSKGVYQGTKPSIDRNAVLKLLSEGVSPTQAAKTLGIGRNSVYRIKAEVA